jgi:hypothetical protein
MKVPTCRPLNGCHSRSMRPVETSIQK